MAFQLGLIGYPIQHSLSPWIHQQFLQRSKIDGTYKIHEVNEELLQEQVEIIKERNYKGFNVTVPYKQKIIPLLDEVDEYARNIGAVNTVLNRDGYLIGFNTDGMGYLRSLQEHFPQLNKKQEKQVLLIGAGGAARGIYYALNQFGFNKIDIANRTLENAESIAQLKTIDTTTNILSLQQAEENISIYDLIIQTTNVGMKPASEYSPIKLNGLKQSSIVSDIVYQPIWTTFLKEAKEKGANIHHGHSMLLYQAQLAFEIWFGKSPDLGQMDNELKKVLEG